MLSRKSDSQSNSSRSSKLSWRHRIISLLRSPRAHLKTMSAIENTEYSISPRSPRHDANNNATAPAYQVELRVRGIGVSLIDGSPQELLYVRIADLQISLANTIQDMHLNCSIGNIQVDNQLYSATYPVMLYSGDSSSEGGSSRPFVDLYLVKSHRYRDISFFKYFSFSIVPMDINLDSELLSQLVLFVKRIQVYTKNQNSLVVEQRPNPSSVAEADIQRMPIENERIRSELYFEKLQILPVYATISFSGSNVTANSSSMNSGRPASALAPILRAMGATFANVENAHLQLNPLILEHIFAQPDALSSRILTHYTYQCIRQAYVILGSADLLGNPVGLLKNISTGVKDFFYEPSQAFVRGPTAFTQGLARGVSSLARNTVFGFSTTTSKILTSLNKGLVALMVDEYTGFKPRNFVQGFVQGIAGLVVAPVQGFKKQGFRGVLWGLLIGVSGCIVKPIVGLLNLASRTSDAISAIVDMKPENKQKLKRVRPPRFFNSSDSVLGLYREEECVGEELLSRVSKGRYRSDRYRAHEFVSDDMLALISWCRLFLLHADDRFCDVQWIVSLEDIVSVEVKGSNLCLGHFTSQSVLMSASATRHVNVFQRDTDFMLTFEDSVIPCLHAQQAQELENTLRQIIPHVFHNQRHVDERSEAKSIPKNAVTITEISSSEEESDECDLTVP